MIPMLSTICHRSLRLSVVLALFAAHVTAEVQDAAPVDLTQLLQELQKIKEQQAQQAKANRQRGLQEAQAAAASLAAAAAAWEEAVRQTQFEGSPKEGPRFRNWKEGEGNTLSEKEVQSAARLFFQWLALTLQRAMGVPASDLLPQVIQHTKEVTADLAAVDALEERIKRQKELAASGKQGKGREKDDEQVKRMHDQILRTALAGSPPVQALNISEFVNVEGWEQVPGNVEGIFQKIILPQLRAAKDPRLLEYWDMRIRREGEVAAKSQLAFEAEKFTQIRRPELLWSKAEELLVLGQRNKAITEMFAIVKSHPAHPQALIWLGKLEQLLKPNAPAPAAGTAAAAAAPTTTSPP